MFILNSSNLPLSPSSADVINCEFQNAFLARARMQARTKCMNRSSVKRRPSFLGRFVSECPADLYRAERKRVKREQRIYDAERTNGRGQQQQRSQKSCARDSQTWKPASLSFSLSPRSVKESKRECQVRLRRTTMRNKGGTDADADGRAHSAAGDRHTSCCLLPPAPVPEQASSSSFRADQSASISSL